MGYLVIFCQVKKSLLMATVFLMCCSMFSWALPPEHEVQRLLLSASKALDSDSMDKAAQQLERIQKLEIEPPSIYYYYQGRVFHHQKRYIEAKSMLETYVVRVGADGEHYSAALDMITVGEESLEAEDKISKENDPQSSAKPLTNIQWKPQSSDDYLSSLRQQYLANNDIDALRLHINSLLKDNAFHGSRLKTKGQKKGTEYSVDISSQRELLIKEKDYRGKSGPRLDVRKMDVYGIDPLIQYGCDYNQFVCWLYHPVNDRQRWILLDRNDQAAQDVSKAMSRLIRLLQKGSAKN